MRRGEILEEERAQRDEADAANTEEVKPEPTESPRDRHEREQRQREVDRIAARRAEHDLPPGKQWAMVQACVGHTGELCEKLKHARIPYFRPRDEIEQRLASGRIRRIRMPLFDHTVFVGLEHRGQLERLFVAMYAGDKEDEERRFDPAVIEKLNPLYGVSLNPTSIETEEREARKSEAKLQEYKRTRLNLWSRAAGNLFSTECWDACGDPKLTLDALKGFPMYVGVDLASASDLNAASFLIEVGEVLYAVFRYWLPERSPRFKDDRYADQFMAWERAGHLTTTRGSHVHHPTILADILAMIEGHNVAAFGVDRFQADFLAGAIEERGHTVYSVSKTASHITRSTDDLVTRHDDPARLQHDGNPVTSWMAGNVVGHWDANDNVLALV
jgi:hypothetical protein